MSRGKSPRRDAMIKAMSARSLTAFELAAETGVDLLYVREELCRMHARGEVRQLAVMRRSLGRIKARVYALDYSYVPKPPPPRIREFKPKPRKPRPGSGQRAAPCISRMLKWDAEWAGA